MTNQSLLLTGAVPRSAFSGNSSTEPPVSSNTDDPFGAFFNYAAHRWIGHLGSAPVDFSLDDVLKLASSTSARQQAWALETCGSDWRNSIMFSFTSTLSFLALYGNVSMLDQLLDRLALNADGDRESIVNAVKAAILRGNPGTFRALVNHQSTAMAMQRVKILEALVQKWWLVKLGRDNLKEWTRLVTGLFDTLASDTIPSPNSLLTEACAGGCMPIVEKIFEQAKANPAFQGQLMQPTNGRGPLGGAVWSGDVEILRYLCQQDGIEAHASNRGDDNSLLNLASCPPYARVEIIELLLDKFPWLMSGRGGVDNELIRFITNTEPVRQTSKAVNTAKFLLQHMQATPGLLVDVDMLLAKAAWAGWPEMCQMLIVDGHARDADGRTPTVVQASNSGQFELKVKEHYLEDRPPYQRSLGVGGFTLPEEVLEAIEGAIQAANTRLPSGDYKLPFVEGKKTEALQNRDEVVATLGPTITLAWPPYCVCIPGIEDQTIRSADIGEKLREANKLRSLVDMWLITPTSRQHVKPKSTVLAYISDRDEANRLCQDGAFLDGSRHVACPCTLRLLSSVKSAGASATGKSTVTVRGIWQRYRSCHRTCKKCWGFGHREEHCVGNMGEI